MAAAICVNRGPNFDLPSVGVYCGREELISGLTDGLKRMECHFELHLESGKFMETVLESRPDVLVLCFSADDGWAEVGIVALRKTCPDAKIIYATQKPGMADAKSLGRGVFYYAGDAGCGDILAATEAALKNRKIYAAKR